MRGWWYPAVLQMPSVRCPPTGESLGVCHDSRREEPGSSWQLPLRCVQKRCPGGAPHVLRQDKATPCLKATLSGAHQAAWPEIYMLTKVGISTTCILVPCLLHIAGTLTVLVIQQVALLVIFSISHPSAAGMEQGAGLSSCYPLQQQPSSISQAQQKRSLLCRLLAGTIVGQPHSSTPAGRAAARGQTQMVPQTCRFPAFPATSGL